ncbi:hypothetical protein BGZ68_000739 [Mortierella alpina]|nr:hypothetical protein BGZ68_000739 [Mortierella alpina]
MHGQGDLTHIEHFANMHDYFARTGILSYQPAVLPGNRYDGKFYINPAGVGHLLNMHYLSNMFLAGGAGVPSNMATYLGGGGALVTPPGPGGGPGGGPGAGPGGGGGPRGGARGVGGPKRGD